MRSEEMNEGDGYIVASSQVTPFTARGAIRHAALTTLSGLWRAGGGTERALRRPRVHFVYLHHVFPDEEESFRKLLVALDRDHVFISHSEAVERLAQEMIDRPYVSFSMDDGLKTCRRAAAILSEFGARACFFLITSMVGESDPGKVRQFCASRLQMPPVEFLTWDDAEFLRRQGHEIGSHTLTHARLADIQGAELEREIFDSAEMLRRRLGEAGHFAWPYGRFSDISARAVELAFRAGFSSLASSVRGCHVAGASPVSTRDLCILRDHTVAHWPVAHTLYFLARSSASASPADGMWSTVGLGGGGS
jgi:peptidoglycan/xylan/chitin deacetylase (PgdA/CDA1 family)